MSKVEQAISILNEAFPAFAGAEILSISHYCGPPPFSWSRTLKLGDIFLVVYCFSGESYALELNVDGDNRAEGHAKPTLLAAIASLRQAAAEQMAVLGLVAEARRKELRGDG